MGQQLDTMNHRSPAELLYDMVPVGSIQSITALHQKGASLEWTDREGKTPLILACLNSSLFPVAKGLIELGANVNAFHRGRDGGTPLHHAATRGSKQIVGLLLSHKAKVLVKNDNDQTPLDVARSHGHTNIVRMIENHICYFSGMMREFYSPWLLGALTNRLKSKFVWVVVVPNTFEDPLKLEIVIYPTQQSIEPRTVIALCKSKIEEPIFDDQSDPKLTIIDSSSGTKYRFSSEIANDKQQLQSLYNACKGIPQVKQPSAISQANVEPWNPEMLSSASSSNNGGEYSKVVKSNKGVKKPFMGDEPDNQSKENNVKNYDKSTLLVPSAPFIDECYPSSSIYFGELDVPSSSSMAEEAAADAAADSSSSASSCAICWDAPVEGACIPCGHMAGCMACLNKIRCDKGVCPICLARMDKVLRLHAV